MYNYPNAMYMNQMGDMKDMSQQMPCGMPQQSYFNQMPTMPMQPIQPMQQTMPQSMQSIVQPQQPIGTTSGATVGGQTVYGTTSGTMPTNIASVPIALEQFGETPVFDTQYTQGYLRTQIGNKVRVEFLIGTNMLVDRTGILLDVGISYIIINPTETDDHMLCDIYSIKFVTIFK